jgi:hypothetical protein
MSASDKKIATRGDFDGTLDVSIFPSSFLAFLLFLCFFFGCLRHFLRFLDIRQARNGTYCRVDCNDHIAPLRAAMTAQ